MRITTQPPIPPQPAVNRNNPVKPQPETSAQSARAERRDTYEPQKQAAKHENLAYDRNGVYVMPDGWRADCELVEGGVEKYTNGLRAVRPITDEEVTLINFELEMSGAYAKAWWKAKENLTYQLRTYFGLDSIKGDESVGELYDMYDKQFGTNSKKELDELNRLRKVWGMVSAMSHALNEAGYDGKDSDSIMDYSDGSFSRADFDYVMGMANSFDYFGSREVTDKSTVNTTDPNVNSDLKDIAMDLFG